MKKINIDDLNEEELKTLHTRISKKLYGFWDVIEKLNKIKEYAKNQEEHVLSEAFQLNALKLIGFTVVVHTNTCVGIINYSIQKDENDNYYGCEFSKSLGTISFDNYQKPTDSDIQKIKEILDIDLDIGIDSTKVM